MKFAGVASIFAVLILSVLASPTPNSKADGLIADGLETRWCCDCPDGTVGVVDSVMSMVAIHCEGCPLLASFSDILRYDCCSGA